MLCAVRGWKTFDLISVSCGLIKAVKPFALVYCAGVKGAVGGQRSKHTNKFGHTQVKRVHVFLTVQVTFPVQNTQKFQLVSAYLLAQLCFMEK